jgi:hypothetical protein
VEHPFVSRCQDFIDAWFKKGDQRWIFSGQAHLPGLAKDSEAISVLAERFKKRQWVGHWAAICMLPIEKREGEWNDEGAE